MKSMLLRKALVVDNVDEDNKDKIKVRILPEMTEVDEDLLPFIYPLFGTDLADTQSHIIPEIDSYVYVILLTDSWKSSDMRYIPKCLVRSEIDYDIWNDSVKAKINELVSTYDYPQPNIFEFYLDGSAYFRNTETGECGFFHNNESYILWDEDGTFTINNKDQLIKFYNDNGAVTLDEDGKYVTEVNSDIEFTDGNSNTIKTSSAGVAIKDASDNTIAIDNALIDIHNSISDLRAELENLWSAVISINTNLLSFVSTNAVPGSPVTPGPGSIASFTADLVDNNVKKGLVASFLT